jgi:hypothetical protein
MLDFRVTTVRKAAARLEDEKIKIRIERKKSPIILEYERYLMNLERGKAIEITLKDGDKFQTIRYRLNTAAKSLRIKNLRIRRSGNKVMCYREAQPRQVSGAGRMRRTAPVRGDTQANATMAKLHDEHGMGAVDEEATWQESLPEGEPEDRIVEAPAPVPTPPEAAPLLELKFDEECEMPMVHGIKTCETRERRYAREGFEAFGHQYVITKVEQLPLGEVQQRWFKQHGLFSPREFKEVWRHNHNGDFDPEQKVWVHHFSRGFAPPPQPEEGLEALAEE